MNALVIGSTGWRDKAAIRQALLEAGVTKIAHGGEGGAERLVGEVSLELRIPCRVYPADWNRYGHAAGPIRNRKMLDAEQPDLVLAFWDGQSPSTLDLINMAIRSGYDVCLYTPGKAGRKLGRNPVSVIPSTNA
jgi:YspA, cpYpsA-related SLOG family